MEGAILVTTDVVGLYPNIPHGADLEALRKRLNEREKPRSPTEEFIKMTDFVLKNNFSNSMGRCIPELLSSQFCNLFNGSVILTTYFCRDSWRKKTCLAS